MPVLFFILLIILIATLGFWKTLGAIVGAVAMVVLLVILIAAVAAIGGVIAIKRLR